MELRQLSRMLLTTPENLSKHILPSGDVDLASLYTSEKDVNKRQYLVSIQTLRCRFGLTWEELRVSRLRQGLIRRLGLEDLVAEKEGSF